MIKVTRQPIVLHNKITFVAHHTTKFHKRHKHKYAILISVCLMLAASKVATSHYHCMEWIPVEIVDGVAYLVHGIGAIPIVSKCEPLWAFLTS